MRYSSLGRAPTRAMSPVPAKSLLPFLAQLDEEQRTRVSSAQWRRVQAIGQRRKRTTLRKRRGRMTTRKTRRRLWKIGAQARQCAARCRIRRGRAARGGARRRRQRRCRRGPHRSRLCGERRCSDGNSASAAIGGPGKAAGATSDDNTSGANFAGLTLDEPNSAEEGEEHGNTSFVGSVDASSMDSDNDISRDDGNSSAGSAATDCPNEAAGATSNDESVTCFDGCGCWALNEAHPGDVYLSENADVKWPRIRLPLAPYNKVFQHQRIGVQWTASLHRNIIKGGLLGEESATSRRLPAMPCASCFCRAPGSSSLQTPLRLSPRPPTGSRRTRTRRQPPRSSLTAPVVAGDRSVQLCQPFYLINT
jgi:hypothetical protein